MTKEEKTRLRKHIENTAILLMIGLSVLLIGVSLFHSPHLEAYARHYLVLHRTMQRFFGILLLAGAWSLYKRSRAAWLLSLLCLSGNLILHLLRYRSSHIHFFAVPVVFELFVLAVLVVTHKDFFRKPNKHHVRRGILFGTGLILLVIVNSAVRYRAISEIYGSRSLGLAESAFTALQRMFQTSVPASPARHFATLEFVYVCFNWICVIIGLFLILSPFIHKPRPDAEDKKKVLGLLRKYGVNPGCWLYLEDDKTYFFGKEVEGVAAYAISNDTMVILGDPVCSPEDFPKFLVELKTYCNINNYAMMFLSITGQFLSHYKALDFGYVKCGEEPRFRLAEYTLSGKASAKMRAAVNHGRKAGLTVYEYHPLEKRDTHIEEEIEQITKEWLATKKSHEELIFTLGGPGLLDPNDKRYFYAVNEDGQMQGFIVFLPFMQKKGYYADVTRRRPDSPGGTMEVIMYEAFEKMKEEKVEWVSMGLAPLAHLDKEDDKGNKVLAAMFTIIHDHFNSVYDFENLSRAKQKYNPTVWEPAYFAYSPRLLTPAMALAVIAVQSPTGISQYVTSFFQNLQKKDPGRTT